MGEAETKLGVYGRHRFCLVMENALNHDYVSEKLWDAFAGGCVPVYYVRPTPASALLQHGCQRACSDVRRCLPVSALQAGKPSAISGDSSIRAAPPRYLHVVSNCSSSVKSSTLISFC